MGKKQKKNAPAVKESAAVGKKLLSMTKRNELNGAVNQLLKLGFLQTINPAEQWNHFIEIFSLLERVKAIEAEISVINRKSTKRAGAIDDFTAWVAANGGKFDGVRIAEFPGFEYGLEALKEFKANEMIITIPDKIVFTFDKATPQVKMAANMVSLISMPNISLAFLLMVERLSPDSFWKPYFDVLPDRYSTVMYFTPTEMQELKGSNALGPALNQIKNIARQYAILYQIYHAVSEDSQDEVSRLMRERFTFDLYCWAVSTVMTRQNLIPYVTKAEENSNKEGTDENNAEKKSEVTITKPALIPFWDMANHANGHITTSYNLEMKRVESLALKDYKKGDQIFIFYGKRSNTDLLVHNGFVFPGNENETINIHLSLSTSDKLFTERSQLLEKLEIPLSGDLSVLPAPIFISPKLLAFARIFNMSKEQLDHWNNNEKVEDLMHIDCALETEIESKTWNFLHNRLNLLQRMFPTTLEEDRALLQSGTAGGKGQTPKLGHHRAMLIQLRAIEKQILMEASDFAKTRIKI